MSFSEKELAKLKELFQQFDTDNSGAITGKELRIAMERFGVKLTDNEVRNLIKKVDVNDSDDIEFDEFVSICRLASQSEDDYGDELSKVTINRSVSGKNLKEKSTKGSGGDDCFGNADSKFFRLIKQLWERASYPADLEQINSKYGAVKISNGLKLKHPMAVKATTAVLLYLSVSPAWEDFLSDQFYNNLFIAVKNEDNASNYIWLARLLRLLQVNRDFGDWILAKGDTPDKNHLWARVYDISKISTQADVKKETSRAVKEGTRTGAEPGQYCIIPPRIVERMKLDIIWKITDDDKEQLEALARGNKPLNSSSSRSFSSSSSSSSNHNDNIGDQVTQLEIENRHIARVNKEKIESLQKQIEVEKQQEAQARAKLQQGQAKLKELQGKTVVKNSNLSNTTVSDPAAEKSVKDAVAGVQEETHNLVEQIKAMQIENKSMQKLIEEFLAELHKLRVGTEGKSKEINKMKDDLTDFIHDEVESVQTEVLPVVKTSGVSTLPIARVSLGAVQEYHSSLSPRGVHTPPPPPATELELPAGWEKKIDPKTHRYYYYEVTTKIATWKFPQKSLLLSGEKAKKEGLADNGKRDRTGTGDYFDDY